MADPICRWRNPYAQTVFELISILPKEEMTKVRAREIVTELSPNFYRTPYQLACQLGLYHETDGYYFPKFTSTPNEDELNEYLTYWITHYSAPNPYTPSLSNQEPFSIHAEICRRIEASQSSLNWGLVRDDIFQEQIGNNDILINSINAYSPVIQIRDKTIITLKEGISYEDLRPFIEVDINSSRLNKEYFFDLFPIPGEFNIQTEDNSNILVHNISQEEINAITDIEQSNDYSQTEKIQIVKARIGQGYFRRHLIEECPFCPITLVDDVRLLIASHIKPWRSSNNSERINAKNGLLLTPTMDKLFDNGYISFRTDKTLIVSEMISEVNHNKLNLTPNIEIPNLPIGGREDFFEYHRAEILK